MSEIATAASDRSHQDHWETRTAIVYVAITHYRRTRRRRQDRRRS
jgi:hypothetical protein